MNHESVVQLSELFGRRTIQPLAGDFYVLSILLGSIANSNRGIVFLMQKLKFITMEDLLEMLENKAHFKLVEVLAKAEYEKGHIPGAINIPLDELEKLAKQKLKKKETIVVYCGSYTCHASTKAVRKLLDLG